MNIYQELGLTINESKVYEILIKHGKLGSGETSSFSGVPYGKIYSVLDSLITKGLVKVIPSNRSRIFNSIY